MAYREVREQASSIPNLDTYDLYGNLEIQDGEMAGWAFRRLRESKDEAEIEGIREELEKYCGLDTRGMVLVLRGLRRLT